MSSNSVGPLISPEVEEDDSSCSERLVNSSLRECRKRDSSWAFWRPVLASDVVLEINCWRFRVDLSS